MQLNAICRLLCFSAVLVGCAGSQPRDVAAPDAELEGESAAALFAKGQASARRGDSVRAEQYLQLAIQRGFDRQTALPVLLSACLSSLHLRAALDHAESYLLEHPDADDLRYLVAAIRIGLGQKHDAQTELERLLQRNPGHADAHFLLGVLYADFDVGAAREQLRLYLASDPHGRHAAEAESRLSDLASPGSTAVDIKPARDTRRAARASR